jgi:hypothetical protein
MPSRLHDPQAGTIARVGDISFGKPGNAISALRELAPRGKGAHDSRSNVINKCCLQNDAPARRQHRFQMPQQDIQPPNVGNQPQAKNEIETGIGRPEIEYVRINEFELYVGNL